MSASRRGKARVRRVAIAAACCALALTVAACGSDDSASDEATTAAAGATGTGQAEAMKVLAAAEAPKDTWMGPTSAPTPATGKTIGVMPCGKAIEGCERQSRGVVEAAKVLGWKTVQLDPQFDPQKTTAAMNTFITQKVDGIVISSINPASIADSIKRAKDAGIPTVATFSADPVPSGGLTEVGIDDPAAGEAAAAYIVLNGGGPVAIFNQNDSPPVAERAVGLKAGFEKFGGAEVVSDQALTGAQLGPPEDALMSALLKQYPEGELNWVWAGFDFMLTPLVQTAQREGRTDVKGISYDGNQQNLDLIRDGKGQVAVIGYPLEWSGWGAVDQLNRAFNDEDPAPSEGVEFRLLTKETIPPPGQPYVGDIDFRAKYQEIWGK